MPDPPSAEVLPSLLSTTIRRSFVLGRLFFGISLAYVVILTLVLSQSGEASFDSSVPVLLPIFGVLGSLGGMLAFSNDRLKGVFEYLIAYGNSPRSLFANSLLASLTVMSVVLVIAVGLALGVSWVAWHTVPLTLLGLLGLYSIPMCYASASFACMAGMYWTVLSSPRESMNSPIGLMPLVGIGPSILTLVVVGIVGTTYGTGGLLVVLGVAITSTLGLALILLSQVGRLLRTERLLSPM